MENEDTVGVSPRSVNGGEGENNQNGTGKDGQKSLAKGQFDEDGEIILDDATNNANWEKLISQAKENHIDDPLLMLGAAGTFAPRTYFPNET